MSDFTTLPAAIDRGDFTLADVTIPACLLGQAGDLVRTTITVRNGAFSDTPFEDSDARRVTMNGAMALPAFTDMHTHLDKGHIWPRSPNPDGTFMGALETVKEDRIAAWSAEDVRARVEFALRCAHAHGTKAIRTHLDSIPPQDDISWGVFREMREEWAGRIALQAACLVGMEGVTLPSEYDTYAHTAQLVAEAGGVLGTVTYPIPDLQPRLDRFFVLAEKHHLHADFHVDETGDPSVATLRTIAETVLARGFEAPVTVGHCCSLAVQKDEEWKHTLDLVAKAGINVVSLPMCNLYLQAREPRTTPRWRGVTLVHEMVERGIAVAFASDNTRDPFYAYGDLDMLEVMREATRIAHLDHTGTDWPKAFTTTPAQICGFDERCFEPGAPADFVLTRARSWTELFARPQADRIVVRNGHTIDRTLPDYAELDHLMEI
ncbi:MAG: cytosine deaminase [Pseudomonadota bacterium]